MAPLARPGQRDRQDRQAYSTGSTGRGPAPVSADTYGGEDPTLTGQVLTKTRPRSTWDLPAGQATATAAAGGGTPGGSTTQIQFNDS